MSQYLANALAGREWSLSALVFDLDDVMDEEGRPTFERRAHAAKRAGVEMEMRQCPYAGVRNGQWMNASALIQVTQYYNEAMAELAGFRKQLKGRDADWSDILAAVLDLLAQPALCLLENRDASRPISTLAAVEHKLGAGFFGVMRELHLRLAQGRDIPLTVDAFLALVDETNALVGKAEVCAGSPQMIRKASTTLIEGDVGKAVAVPEVRVEVARLLALQVQLGLFWKLYDSAHCYRLLLGADRQHLAPCNDFLRRKLSEAAGALPHEPPLRPLGARLPMALAAPARELLHAALEDQLDDARIAADKEAALALLEQRNSVIAYSGDAIAFATRAACYLYTHRLFKTEIARFDAPMRTLLGYSNAAPVQLGDMAFVYPRALQWYENIIGCRLGPADRLDGARVAARSAVAQ